MATDERRRARGDRVRRSPWIVRLFRRLLWRVVESQSELVRCHTGKERARDRAERRRFRNAIRTEVKGWKGDRA